MKVLASFDDGSLYDLRTADMLYRYGIEATFYIPVNWQKYLAKKGIEPLDDAHIESLVTEFNIGSHGVNHELLTRIDEEAQRFEIFDSLDYWTARHIPVRSFCYPRGYYTEDIKKLVKKAGYGSARTVKVGELNPPKDAYETHTTLHVGLDRKEYGCSWMQYGRKMIERALEKEAVGEDVVFHFWGHSAEIHTNDQWQNLEKFMKEVHENLCT